jgi:hypothetical protein
MNQITDLQLAGVSALPVEVWLGQWLSGLRIIGTSRYLEQASWPDLTRRSECLDISLASSGTVRHQRGDQLSLQGLAEGTTSLRTILRGSASAGIQDVDRYFGIRVRRNLLPALQQTVKVQAPLRGHHLVRDSQGKIQVIGKDPPEITVPETRVVDFRYPSWQAIRTRWEGPDPGGQLNFQYKGSCQEREGADKWDFEVAGTVYEMGAMIGSARFQMTFVSVGGTREIMGYRVSNVPFTEESRYAIGDCREQIFRVLGPDVQKHVEGISYYFERGTDRSTYVGTEWNNPSVYPALTVRFKCPN